MRQLPCCKISIITTVGNIDGVMVSVFASSVVDRMFESRSGQTKDYKIGMCCFSANHTALRGKSKDWLARTWDNVSCGATCIYTDTCQKYPVTIAAS